MSKKTPPARNDVSQQARKRFVWTELAGMFAVSPQQGRVEFLAADGGMTKFTIATTDLGAVLYEHGAWGPALVMHGRKIHNFQVSERVAQERGLA